jgi:hypothetical protein
MRLRIVGLLVALGALLAACGGGGGGKAVLPSISQPTASAPTTPGQQATKRMAMTINIPPASKQSKARRQPYFVSPNTQSIAIAVVPNGSGTPVPSELQVFPVTTPSPCATTNAGGESCTFNVTAPYGTDIFYVATFAVASPNPASTTVPLASFVSGAIVISSPVPGVTPSPLAFTMNGIVYSVAVTVPSPDPSNTPNTQVMVVASPTSVPLGITPYDSSGAPILADAFLAPIPVIVTPPGEGIGLTLTSASPCPGSSGNTTPSSVVDIGCAADLANVQIVYPGTIFADSSDHIIDTFAIAAPQQASPSPSPASVVLASNVISSVPPAGGVTYNIGYLQALPSNVIAYMLTTNSATTAAYGTLNVATGAYSTALTLTTGTYPTSFYTMSDGSIWVTNGTSDSLQCFAPGATTATPLNLSGFMQYVDDVTFDGTNLYVAGYMGSNNVISYGPITSQCNVTLGPAVTLPNSVDTDSALLMVPQTSGGVLVDGQQDGGAWTMTGSGVATQLNPGFTPGSGFGGGVGIDGTGVGYFIFNPEPNGTLFNLTSGGTSFNASPLLTLPPMQTGSLGALAAFGPNNGSADRIGYAATPHNAFGIVEGPNSATPVQIVATIGNASLQTYGQDVAVSTGGAGFIAYTNVNTGTMNIARTYYTTTWWAPVTALAKGQGGGVNNTFSVDERGDSGPFTITTVGTPPSCYTGNSLLSGTDHTFVLGNSLSSPCTVTLQISDKNGRAQVVTVTLAGVPEP